MKLPTLRQVSGFVMLVNTFLPAIVVLTLGLMVWSTITVVRGQRRGRTNAAKHKDV
ncbi:MAG: hypothetical protein ACE5HM_04480 [Acidiferrobacterales bacterium]